MGPSAEIKTIKICHYTNWIHCVHTHTHLQFQVVSCVFLMCGIKNQATEFEKF